MAVKIFFNVPTISKIGHVLVSLTYKRHKKPLGGQYYFILLQNKDFGWSPMVSRHVLVKLHWLLWFTILNWPSLPNMSMLHPYWHIIVLQKPFNDHLYFTLVSNEGLDWVPMGSMQLFTYLYWLFWFTMLPSHYW